MQLSDSALRSGSTMNDFVAASNAILNSSDARANASLATYEADTIINHEEVRDPAFRLDEQGTPSSQETEAKPVDDHHLGEQRWLVLAEPSESVLGGRVRRSTRDRRPPT